MWLTVPTAILCSGGHSPRQQPSSGAAAYTSHMHPRDRPRPTGARGAWACPSRLPAAERPGQLFIDTTIPQFLHTTDLLLPIGLVVTPDCPLATQK